MNQKKDTSHEYRIFRIRLSKPGESKPHGCAHGSTVFENMDCLSPGDGDEVRRVPRGHRGTRVCGPMEQLMLEEMRFLFTTAVMGD